MRRRPMQFDPTDRTAPADRHRPVADDRECRLTGCPIDSCASQPHPSRLEIVQLVVLERFIVVVGAL